MYLESIKELRQFSVQKKPSKFRLTYFGHVTLCTLKKTSKGNQVCQLVELNSGCYCEFERLNVREWVPIFRISLYLTKLFVFLIL